MLPITVWITNGTESADHVVSSVGDRALSSEASFVARRLLTAVTDKLAVTATPSDDDNFAPMDLWATILAWTPSAAPDSAFVVPAYCSC